MQELFVDDEAGRRGVPANCSGSTGWSARVGGNSLRKRPVCFFFFSPSLLSPHVGEGGCVRMQHRVGGCGRLATQRDTTRAQRAISRQPGVAHAPSRPEVSAFCCATARRPHQRRLHPASAEARSAGGARWAPSRANRLTSSAASQPHRPPTSHGNTTRRCGPAACSSG